MPQDTLANRLAILEHKVAPLEQLPDRMASLEGQISQFREEVRVEFSAVRGDMKELHGIAMTRMDELHGVATTRMDELHSIAMRELRAGDEETRRQMRVLHEEVMSRIALLDEGLNGKRRSGSAPSRERGTKRRGLKR